MKRNQHCIGVDGTFPIDPTDTLCPAGYRLLIQSADHETEAEFRAWIVKLFAAKGKRAVIKIGFCDHGRPGTRPVRFTWWKIGFRAYVKR